MAKEIILPKFGFTQEESEILEWLHNEGDQVEKGDPIAVVSTDKISMEVESPETGILAGIKYPIGSVVPVTEIIAYILAPGEALPLDAEKKAVKVSEKPEKTAETKSSQKISPVAAKIIEEKDLLASEIDGSGPGGQITKGDAEKYLTLKTQARGKVKTTPSARRIAEEKGINLHAVTGSGPDGRIQADDVLSIEKSAAAKMPPLTPEGVSHEIPLVGMRRTIAENMSRSMREAPHMTLQVDIVMDAVEDLRKETNSRISENNKKISATAVIVKTVAMAIRKNPIINSQYTPEKILLLDAINIGVAVAINEGLIVPVVASADKKSIQQISTEVNDLASRARDSRLKPQDLLNGTFTISNLGMLGVDRFTAIINPPQSAILAVGAIRKQLITDESDAPVIRIAKIMSVTLSADHRVMDGAQAAYFLADLKHMLENPAELFV